MTFVTKSPVPALPVRESYVADRRAYFGHGSSSLRMYVELATGVGYFEPNTSHHAYLSHVQGNTLRSPELADNFVMYHEGGQKVDYTVAFRLYSKYTYSTNPVKYESMEAVIDPDPTQVPMFVTETGALTLLLPFDTEADGSLPAPPYTGHIQPTEGISTEGCEFIRAYLYEEGYDPQCSDIYHKVQYTTPESYEQQNRASALLRDIADRPVFVAIVPKSNSISRTELDVTTLYIADDSPYIDQYGTETRTIKLQS